MVDLIICLSAACSLLAGYYYLWGTMQNFTLVRGRGVVIVVQWAWLCLSIKCPE
jgi:hypothetical protein